MKKLIVFLVLSNSLIASGFRGGDFRLPVHGIGISPEAVIDTSGPGQKSSLGLNAGYHASSISMFSYHASFGGGYLVGRNQGYVNAIVGIGIVITFIDIGYMHTYGENDSGIQTGFSFEQIIPELNLLGQFYGRYTFSINNGRDNVQLGLKAVYLL